MKLSLRAVLAAGVAGSLAAGLLVTLSGQASATGVPQYEPDSTNQFGTLAFYDASGNRVTGGSTTDDPFATFAVASSDDPNLANNSGALYGYLPVNGVPPASWNGDQLSGTTSFPVASPASIAAAGTHRPVVTNAAGDETLAQLQASFPNNATDSYQGLYQLRLITPGSTKWWAADIQITGSTWTQVYPTIAPDATSTTLVASPTSQAYVGQPVTLTATISPSTAAGSVQFKDNGSDLGASVAVTSGQAVSAAMTPSAGSHSWTAAFTPSDSVAYGASTSAAVPYTVLAAPSWKPALYGSVRVGYTPACVAAFDGAQSVAYSWYQNGVAISGATAPSYKVPEAYYRKSLTCRATATNPGGTASALSSAVTVGVGPALKVVTRPSLSGTHHYGSYETCKHGTWSPGATSYLYQWYVGTKAIAGKTSYRYLMPKAYYGKVISCRVTARRAAWTNGVFRTAGVKIT